MRFGEFMGSETARVRYWARATVGWERFSRARPNAAHSAIAELEAIGAVRGVITQNVDGLHQAAGSQRVVELHGTVSKVRCMGCGVPQSRTAIQARIRALNPDFTWEVLSIAPDGDAELPAEAYTEFRVPACLDCGGVLKPDVVFFGETVPRSVVDDAWRLFDEGALLLVAGSSLTVFSGRRFVLRATERGIPVVIVNEGPTQGDEIAAFKVEARLGVALPRLLRTLESTREASAQG
jgi:NAD-dependent SIR2 family protein deacetylase